MGAELPVTAAQAKGSTRPLGIPQAAERHFLPGSGSPCLPPDQGNPWNIPPMQAGPVIAHPRPFLFSKGPTMTVSAATASIAAAQAAQAARAANAGNTGSASGAAFSAVANAAQQLPGIAATGGSMLSSSMLSSLLGMNNTTPAAPPPNSAGNATGASASTSHHHGVGAYVEGLATTAATLLTAAAV